MHDVSEKRTGATCCCADRATRAARPGRLCIADAHSVAARPHGGTCTLGLTPLFFMRRSTVREAKLRLDVPDSSEAAGTIDA